MFIYLLCKLYIRIKVYSQFTNEIVYHVMYQGKASHEVELLTCM